MLPIVFAASMAEASARARPPTRQPVLRQTQLPGLVRLQHVVYSARHIRQQLNTTSRRGTGQRPGNRSANQDIDAEFPQFGQFREGILFWKRALGPTYLGAISQLRDHQSLREIQHA